MKEKGEQNGEEKGSRSLTPRVLVADGRTETCEKLQHWLESDYMVLFAHNGESALKIARAIEPACVLLDTALPKVSGLAVAWVLRNDPRYGAPPIILMSRPESPPTDPCSPDDRDFWLEGLADAHLAKPLKRDLVVHAVSRHFLPVHRLRTDRVSRFEQDERRLYPRRPVRIPARLSAHGEGADGELISLSPTGAFIATRALLDPGARADIRFTRRDGLFEGACEVLYRSESSSLTGMGIAFRDLTPDAEARLLRAMESR